jgi:hypothetical protein
MVSMGRVEWLALGGDEVETQLANLIYNDDGRAIRIRPSQGDYGIDIIIPTAANPEKWDVYQVKKFARNLTSGQKAQIVESFGRVLVGLLRRKVPLNNWYLVLPLDPTLENYLEWLQGMPEEAIDKLKKDKKLNPQFTDEELERIQAWLDMPDRVIGWKGLPFCESLVADYPYVVDYYLHGGRERLREAVADVAKLLGRDSSIRELDEAANHAEGNAAVLEPGRPQPLLPPLRAISCGLFHTRTTPCTSRWLIASRTRQPGAWQCSLPQSRKRKTAGKKIRR